MKFQEYCKVLDREVELFKSKYLERFPDMADQDIGEGDWHEQFSSCMDTGVLDPK